MVCTKLLPTWQFEEKGEQCCHVVQFKYKWAHWLIECSNKELIVALTNWLKASQALCACAIFIHIAWQHRPVTMVTCLLWMANFNGCSGGSLKGTCQVGSCFRQTIDNCWRFIIPKGLSTKMCNLRYLQQNIFHWI